MYASTLSSPSKLMRLTIALPLLCFEPSGTSKMRIQKHRPLAVKMSNQLWLVAVKMLSRKSSSRVALPLEPTPPLPWALYSDNRVRLM